MNIYTEKIFNNNMKTLHLIFIFAIIGFCYTDDLDTCTKDYESSLIQKCTNIGTCEHYDISPLCISTKNNDCSRGNNDPVICGKIFPNTFPRQKCDYVDSTGICQPKDILCYEFNSPINGVIFDKKKDRDICSQLKASNGMKCLISDSDSFGYSQGCREYPTSCDETNSGIACSNKLLSYEQKCHTSDGQCRSTPRTCDTTLHNVNKIECQKLNSLDNDKKCVYKDDGTCMAVYSSCNVYSPKSDCEGEAPLQGNEYNYNLICKYVAATSTTQGYCTQEERTCKDYHGNDRSICEGLKAKDTNKWCIFDPDEPTNNKCKEVYSSCKLYSDNELSKTRIGCEKQPRKDNEKCVYNIEEDQCLTEKNYTSCEEYEGISQIICESIKPSPHSRCVLDKDSKCKERAFFCSEVFDWENCLYYAKAKTGNKRCAFKSSSSFKKVDECYEEYLRCEDYIGEIKNDCENIRLYDGKKCVFDSNTNRCLSKNKTCSEVNTKEECNFIAKSGVSNPDKLVCRFFEEYDASGKDISYCMETYRYCSDYRGEDPNFCEEKIKPYIELEDRIDIAYKCQLEDKRCQKVPKECTDTDVVNNPFLCTLISPTIQDNNVKYCTFINGQCQKHFKKCNNWVNTNDPTACTDIVPENYLGTPCGIKTVNGEDTCIEKDVCNLYSSIGINDAINSCHLINHDCDMLGSVCTKKKEYSCEEITFYKDDPDNEKTCKDKDASVPYKICTLKEDKSGCEEILDTSYLSPSITEKDSSEFIKKRIRLILILLCLLI